MARRHRAPETPGRIARDGPSQRHGRGVFIAALLACGACCVWATTPVAAAAPLRASHRAKEPTGEDSQLPGTIEPQICASCAPPLAQEGGPVMDTNGADGLTITPIWWQPSGGRYVFPSVYEHLLDQYVHDIAAASGSTDNVFSVLAEYYQTVDGLKKYLTYKFTAGTPVVDTAAFPANGCKPAPGTSACITDAQLRDQLRAVIASHKLPTTMAYYYPVFFPRGSRPKTATGPTPSAITAATTRPSVRALTRPSTPTCLT